MSGGLVVVKSEASCHDFLPFLAMIEIFPGEDFFSFCPNDARI